MINFSWCCFALSKKRETKKSKTNKIQQALTEREASALLFHADGAVYQLPLRAGRRPKPRCIAAGSN